MNRKEKGRKKQWNGKAKGRKGKGYEITMIRTKGKEKKRKSKKEGKHQERKSKDMESQREGT